MSETTIYIKKKKSISNNKSIHSTEKNILSNCTKNQPKLENHLKKKYSYSKLISDDFKCLEKSNEYINIANIEKDNKNLTLLNELNKTCTNLNKNIIENKNFLFNKTLNSNIINNGGNFITKHSSMKYFKISPIIKPIYNRVYFSPKNKKEISINTNLNLNNIIKNIKIEDCKELSSPREKKRETIFNNGENIPIQVTNNINIINNNLITNTNEEKKLVFIKKRIPSCGKNSLSMPKIETNDKNSENYYSNVIKLINKKIETNVEEKNNSSFNNKKLNKNIINYYSQKFQKIDISKNKNLFNKENVRQINSRVNLGKINKNYFIDLNRKCKQKYAKENNNSNNNSNVNIYEQTKIAFKELNLEDFLLIIQKFDDIRNNLKDLNSFSSNKSFSTKNILKISHINCIKLYDLFTFFMGSSFDGSPEKLFSPKKTKFYFHLYTIIFILSLGTIYIISQNINLIQEKIEEIIKLIDIQEKIFLLFCDAILKKLNKKYRQNIWVAKLMNILKNKSKLFNNNNYIKQIKDLILESYTLINNLLININNNNIQAQTHENTFNYPEKYILKNYFNKSINYLSEIEINQIEEEFIKNIFKMINLRNNFVNNPYFQRIITLNDSKENNNNSNYNNKIINKTKKLKNNNQIYNRVNLTNNYLNNINKNIINKKNIYNNYNPFNKNHKIKNSSIQKDNNIIKINNNLIQQYEIQIPDTEVKIAPVSIPFLNFPTNKKYTLVIDLDETMVNFKFTNIQKSLGILYLRPSLGNFLEVIKDYYEIIAFTSALRDYADIVLDIIEKNERKKYFEGRLYREHTTQFGKKYIKDLSKIGRDLGRIIIVDNLSQCFKLHSENGILISSFYGENEDDKALIELQKILIKIYYENDDVRKSINKYKDEIFNKISKSW